MNGLVAQLLYNVAKLSGQFETENMGQASSNFNPKKLSKILLPKATKEDMLSSSGFQTMTSLKTASTEKNSSEQSTKRNDKAYISRIQSLVGQLESAADSKTAKENDQTENTDITQLIGKVKEELGKVSKTKNISSPQEFQSETVIKSQPFTLKPVKKNKI